MGNLHEIIIPAISGATGVFGALFCVIFKFGKYVEKIDKLEKSLECIYVLREQMAALQQFEKNATPKIFQSRSPISLTIYAENLLKDIKWEDFFESIKNQLAVRLDSLKLKTRYDVQEKSKEILLSMQDDDLFIPLKTKAYDMERCTVAKDIPLAHGDCSERN